MSELGKTEYSEYKGNCLICLSGKIETNTSEEWKEKLNAIRDDHPQGRLILDLKGVNYISSAGLRVLLQLGKKEIDRYGKESDYSKIWIRNVADNIYDVMVVTGFIEMFIVSKPLAMMTVEGLPVIGVGASGKVYRIGSDRIVKVFGGIFDYTELEAERVHARTALIQSIPTAIPFEIVQTEEGLGLIFELVDAKSVTKAMLDDPANTEDYMRRFADLAHKVNSTECDPGRFHSIKDLYKSRILASAPYYKEGDADKLIRLIDNIPERHTMIHGDFHPGNVMINSDKEMFIIDMFELSYGHPMFDVMSMVGITHSWTLFAPQMATGYFSMTIDQLNEVYKYYIKYYFNGLSEQDRDIYGQILGKYSLIRSAVAPALAKSLPEEMKHGIAGGAVNLIRNETDSLLETMDWGIFDSIAW